MIIKIIVSLLIGFLFIYIFSKTSILFSLENQNQQYKYYCEITFNTQNTYPITLYSDKNTYGAEDIRDFLERQRKELTFETTTHKKVFIKNPKISEISFTCSENISLKEGE